MRLRAEVLGWHTLPEEMVERNLGQEAGGKVLGIVPERDLEVRQRMRQSSE